jgi:hypothetical protein
MVRRVLLRLFPSSSTATLLRLFALVGLCLGLASVLPALASAAEYAPVAEYSFDEGEEAGETVEDLTGDRHAATIHGAKRTVHGRYGGALEFDAAEHDYVSIPASEELDNDEELTVEAWVRPSGPPNYFGEIAMKEREGSGPAYSWTLDQHETEASGYFMQTEEGMVAGGPQSIPLHTWTHVALTDDGAHNRLYVNGQLLDTEPAIPFDGHGEIKLGGNGVFGQWFDGRIDEVRIYDRAITGAEIVTDMEMPLQTPRTTPVASYSFDEENEVTQADTSGDGHTATVEGAKWTGHGRYGGAMEFDAAEHDVLKIPDSPELDFSEEFTLEAWVRPVSATQEWEPAIAKGAGEGEASQTPAYNLYAAGAEYNHPLVAIRQVGGSKSYVQAGRTLPAHVWSHIALVYDGSLLHVYVNGEDVNDTPSESPVSTSGDLEIGGAGALGEYFGGRIDEVRVYGRDLNSNEVANDMEAPIQTPKQGPVAAYSFDEGEEGGETVEDVTGDGHTATIEDGTRGKGRYGGGVEFDGLGGNQCVSVPDSPDLRLSEEFTLEAWVRPLGGVYEDPAIVREAGGKDAFGLGLGSRVESAAEGFIGHGKGSEAAVGGEVRENEWTPIATTYDGAVIRVYEEGVLVDEEFAPTPPATGAGPLKIGCDVPDGQFTGGIDEVRVYNRALTDAEVAVTAESPLETAKAAPVAAYSFDEDEGETVEDVSGGGHTATIEGAEWNIRGRYGAAMEFDAAKDAVLKIPASPELDFNEGFTLEAWVRPSGENNDSAPLIDKQEGSGLGYFLYEGGSVSDRPVGAASEEQEYVHADDPLPAHAWSHVALVFTGGRTYLYVDGELIDNGAAEPLVTEEGELEIGGSTDTSNYFDGRIDEVRIYNRPLNTAEVGADMEAPLQAEKSSPIAEYTFDEGSGSTVEDVTGNGHTATIEGAEWTPHGRYGAAMEFDGEEAALSIPASSDLDLTEEFTLAAWIRPEELREFDSIFSKENSGEPSFAYLIEDHHRQLASYFGGSTKNAVYGPGEEIEPDTWTHVAVTYDGAWAHLYINGELVESGQVPCIPMTNGELRIGSSDFLGAENDFKGRIDEVRIWNRALPPSEVAQSMSPPPAVITEPASEAQANEAIFNGLLTVGGENTDYFFEYGPTTAYGGEIGISEEFEESTAAEGEVEVSEAAVELEPETTYHYRLVAVSPGGMSRGADQTVTTGARTMSKEEEEELRAAAETETLLGSEAGSSSFAPFATKGLNDFYGVQWTGEPTQASSTETLDSVQEVGAGFYRIVSFKPFDPLIEENEKAREKNKEIEKENKETGGSKPLEKIKDERESSDYETREIAKAAARGITILPDIGSGAFPTKSHWGEWKEFARKMVMHYGPGSGYSQPIRAWEIWNEPNMPQAAARGYEEKVNPELFGEFFAEMAGAIRAAAPAGPESVEILSPALYGYKSNVGCGKDHKKWAHPNKAACHETPDSFLDGMGHEGAYEAISLHPYVFTVKKHRLSAKNVPGVEKEVWRKISKVRKGRREKQVWITELGFPVEYPNSPGHPKEHQVFPPVSPELQAKLTRAVFVMLHNRRGQLNVHRAIYYNIADTRNPPNPGEAIPTGWASACGLLKSSGAKRPAFAAYKKLLHE